MSETIKTRPQESDHTERVPCENPAPSYPFDSDHRHPENWPKDYQDKRKEAGLPAFPGDTYASEMSRLFELLKQYGMRIAELERALIGMVDLVESIASVVRPLNNDENLMAAKKVLAKTN